MAVAGASAAAAALASAGSGVRRCPWQQPGPHVRCSLTAEASSRVEAHRSVIRPASRRPTTVAAAAKAPERGAGRRQLFVQVEPDGSDSWRLDPVVEALKQGAVGIIPTGEDWPAVASGQGGRMGLGVGG